MSSYKTVKWFKEGDRIPQGARLIQTKEETEFKRPPEGGDMKPITHSLFLYEYDVEE